MNIQAINPSFQGKRDRVDAFINMDDNKLRQMAYVKTVNNFDEKKSRRVTNALFYAAPIAAGLGVALLSGGNTKIFSKEVTGLAARAAKGLKVAAVWTAALGAIDLLGFAKNKLSQKSPNVRKFDREHPFMSMAAMIAAGFGMIALVNKGAAKLAKVKAPKFMQTATEKVAKFLNNNKLIGSAKAGVKRLLAKTPSALKEFGKTALSWAPTALLFGGLLHSISSNNAENKEFAKNYNDLREKQTRLTRARMAELTVENDFYKLDPKNREDVELLKDPMMNL